MTGSDRAFPHDRYWLKRALVRLAEAGGAPGDASGDGACGRGGADGMVLVDVRIECGVIRAVVAAGGAPCCGRGVDLEGGIVRPLHPAGRIAPGRPADLRVTHGRGGAVVLVDGKPDGPCTLCIDCVCTPPPVRS